MIVVHKEIRRDRTNFKTCEIRIQTSSFKEADAFMAMTDNEIDIMPKKKKRSLNANNYYYKLTGELAKVNGITITELHNRQLAELGIAWTNQDGDMHWILQKDDDWWLKQTETHLAPTDKTETRKNRVYRWFYLLKPSHLFTTSEMARLIDSVVQDCKAVGIETLPPAEIKRLKEMWKQ